MQYLVLIITGPTIPTPWPSIFCPLVIEISYFNHPAANVHTNMKGQGCNYHQEQVQLLFLQS
jgi:hypothetical protein